MKLQEKMFGEVRLWNSSSKKRIDFVENKDYSLAKFDYWINKYNKTIAESSTHHFKEIPIQEELSPKPDQSEKMIELETPSGIKITIYK
jgi:hypothetical protein